jgi:hypothetical protein
MIAIEEKCGTKDERDLTNLFARLGARNPEQWARSQIEERIPQVARFLFLRQAWKLVVPEHDCNWIDEQANIAIGQPGGSIGAALGRLLAHGADRDDLTTVVRVMQWKLLAGLCYLLDDPGTLESEVKDVSWRLFQTDDDGQPIAVIASLHESVLDTEPSGQEMRA